MSCYKVPKRIKVAGYDYKVIFEVGGRDERGADDPAAMTPRTQQIWIDSKQTLDGQISSLFHEIIEAINYHYELGLKHHTIAILETAWYQVLKDNKFISMIEEEPHAKRRKKKGARRKNRIQKLAVKSKTSRRAGRG
jgi:hypothetical protein